MRPFVKPTLLIATVSLAVSLSACNTVPPVTGCSELAKGVLGTATPHATLGNSGDASLDWQLYGTSETVQLNRANDDKQTGLAIVQMCEQRDAETLARINRPWWALW